MKYFQLSFCWGLLFLQQLSIAMAKTGGGGGGDPKLESKLFTPTVWAVYPDGLACNICNVGTTTRNARIRVISNADILYDSGVVVVQPMSTAGHAQAGESEGRPVFCEFLVEGNPDHFRGSIKLFTTPASSDIAIMPAT